MMESIRKQYLEGKLEEDEYRKRVCIATILSLAEEDYFCEGQLGVGTFGVIVDLINTSFRQRVAAKIVMQEYVTESEKRLWPLVHHQNILELNDMMYIPKTYCYVFFMDKQTGALDSILDDPSFSSDVRSFDRAISWLRGACEGVKCLHDKKLAHLDLKLGNVLVSDSDTAKICDFGSLTQTEKASDSYQSPFIYRAPEGLVSESADQAVVDAFKYDIYTLGILTLELFSKQTLKKSFSDDWKDSNPNWIDIMYPRIFDMLEIAKFQDLVKQMFPNSQINSQTLNIMRDFIRGCITLNPDDRPTIDQVLEHKLFDGPKVFPEKKNDIWNKKASSKNVQFLLSLYIGRAASFQLPLSCSLPAEESSYVREPNESFVPEDAVEMKDKVVMDAVDVKPVRKVKKIRKRIQHAFNSFKKLFLRKKSN